MCYTGKCIDENYNGECSKKRGERRNCMMDLASDYKYIIVDMFGSSQLDKAKYPYMSYADVIKGINNKEGFMLTHCTSFVSPDNIKLLTGQYGYQILLLSKDGGCYDAMQLINEYGLVSTHDAIAIDDYFTRFTDEIDLNYLVSLFDTERGEK